MWKESSLHDGPTYALQSGCALNNRRKCVSAGIVMHGRSLSRTSWQGLFVQHPIRYCELCTIRQSDLDIVASHDVEPANNGDFFIEVRMEPVVNLRQRRFMGSVSVVSSALRRPTSRDYTDGFACAATSVKARRASSFLLR
jgi:hypothetical protein